MKKIICIIKFIVLFLPVSLLAQLNITQNSTAMTLAQTIAGTGVTISSATINCSNQASGLFTYTGTNLGLPNGIILTTGSATDAANGGNYFCDVQNGHNFNDPKLTSISSQAKKDVCTLTFTFVPVCSNLSITYVFGSEEYPTYVNAGYNDAFGIFLTGPNPSGGTYNGVNIGALPNGTAVSINNVNANTNSTYFVNNYTNPNNDIAYDGYTKAITSTKVIVPCSTYVMEIGIADAGDEDYDSGVFIEGNAVSCQTAPAASIASTSVACGSSNGTASVTVTNYAATPTYQWSTGANTPSISNLAAGTYTCLVTFAAGCSNITQTLVTTVQAPASNFSVTASASPASCPTTANGSATVNISGGAQPYTISWGTNPVQTTTTISNIIAGNYNVNVSDANGCAQLVSATVGVLNQPNATSTHTTVCGNNFVLTSLSGTNYQWYDTMGVAIVGATSQNYPASGLNNGQGWGVSYINNTTTCRDTMVINIDEANINFNYLTTPICNGGTGSLNFNSSGSYSLPIYNWNLTGTSVASGSGVAAPIAISNLAAGTYSIVISQPGNPSCFYTTTVSIVQNAVPISPIDTIKLCNMDVFNLNPSLPAGSTSNWYAGSTATSTVLTHVSLPVSPPQINGTLYVDTVSSSQNCKSVLKYQVLVQSFSAQSTIVKKPKCHNDSVSEIKITVPREVNGPINQPYTFNWTYPNNHTTTTSAGSNVPVTSIEYSLSPGTYTVDIHAGNCVNTVTISIVNPAALPNDSMYGYYCPKDSLAKLVADTGNAVGSYQWYDNGISVTGANTYSLEVVTQSINNYYVKYSRGGCPDSAVKIIPITTYNAFRPEQTVNVFSPNGDGRNDMFYPFYQANLSQTQIAKQAQNYTLKIYNRWGILMYESTDYIKPWDGKTKGGSDAEDGSYFFIVTYQSNCGTKADVVEKKGFIELLR